WTPRASRACTTRSFSSAVSVRPPPPMPSRRVASYSCMSAIGLARGGRVRAGGGALAGGRVQGSGVHDVEPLAVALGAPVDRVLEGGLQHARDLARPAGPDHVVVYLAHGNDLGRGAGHERLVRSVWILA